VYNILFTIAFFSEFPEDPFSDTVIKFFSKISFLAIFGALIVSSVWDTAIVIVFSVVLSIIFFLVILFLSESLSNLLIIICVFRLETGLLSNSKGWSTESFSERLIRESFGGIIVVALVISGISFFF
jgi:hypothetical protein